MEYALIVFRQLVIMFIYMMIGFFLYKRKLLDEAGSKSLGNLLIYIVLPCISIKAFLIPFSVEGLNILKEGFFAAIIALGLGAVICLIIFRKDILTRVGTTFPNAGFIGIPLITAVLGQEAVFYLIPLQLATSFFQYTYAAISLSDKKEKILKSAIVNPLLIAIVIGFTIYILGLGDKIPSVLYSAIDGIYAAQSPLAMILTGTYLAKIDFKHLHLKKDLLASFVRLILIPVCVFFALKLLPINETTKLVMLIAVSCSIGTNISVYAQKFGGDYVYACEVASFSTICSIITLPMILLLLV